MTAPPPTATLPSRCGIGLRRPHVAEVMAGRPEIAWLEVHAENYMAGGARAAELEAIRRDHPVALHGVGLSLGGAEALNRSHLDRLCRLAERIEPCLVSEHLAWSRHGGAYLNDLLPLPYTEESLALVARNVRTAQEALGRPLLIENPSRYLAFARSSIPEAEFLAELVGLTGCGLLCDVNNLYVSCANLGGDPVAWLESLPAGAVREIHLAGHHVNRIGEHCVLIDDHGSLVAAPVWTLFARAARLFPQAAPLIEWDCNLPTLDLLLAEAREADEQRALALREVHHVAAA